MLWVLAPGTGAIDRYVLQGLRKLQPAIPVGSDVRQIVPSAGERAVTALVTGDGSCEPHARSPKRGILDC